MRIPHRCSQCGVGLTLGESPDRRVISFRDTILATRPAQDFNLPRGPRRFAGKLRNGSAEQPAPAEVMGRTRSIRRTHPTSAVLSDAGHFAKRVTLSLALRSLGDAGRGVGRVGAAAALVAG
jgi:hypothetical protein